MKKIFSILGLALFVGVLSGCGNVSAPVEPNAPVKTEVESAPVESVVVPPATTLPETVSTQPGATVEDEITNIDKDLQSIDDGMLNEGLSDADLGL